jgi:predicted DNA binding CopG/RHH family protein
MQPVRSIEQERAMTLTRGMDLTAIEHKRSTVSVRLTDDEFLRLKERACESGISVSAYMRSCILDADQLRTQVKQALAEMRAMTARPDTAMFNALPSPERNVSVHSGDWFRVIVRSAAFLLSPLFPFRRSA